MTDDLNRALSEEVRRWARPTTPEELKRRGVDRVRSISLKGMTQLIEKAVNRTLMARTIGGLDEDFSGFSADAREEFLNLVRDERQRASRGQIEQAAEGELQRLKRELGRRRIALEHQEAALEGADELIPEVRRWQIELRLKQMFAEWDSHGRPHAPEREVLDLVLSDLRREYQEVQRVRLEQHREDVDRLERRVRKLSGLLGQTEEELARLLKLKNIDPGVASVYRDVQGLTLEDALFQKKAELLGEIFQANLELREELAAGESA